jgi:hypothetical protein
MTQQINLFNPVFLKQKKYFSAITMLQALALLLVGILAFYGYTLGETQTLARLSEDTGRQLKTQSEQAVRLTQEFSPQGRSKMLSDELARMTARLKLREDMLSVLRTGGLGNTDGFARYLSAFARQAMSGVWLTGFTIGGDESELLINGRVLQSDLVPAYIRALSREDVMRGRRVTELRLTAREVRDAPGTAAPGAAPAITPAPAPAPGAAATPAPGAAATPAPVIAPQRYVEFNITAVRGNAPPSTPDPAAAKADAGAKEPTQ